MRVRLGIGIGLILLIGLIAGTGGIVSSDDRPPIGQAPPVNNTTTADVVTQPQSQSQTEAPQTYAVTADSADAIDTDQLAEYGEVGTQVDARIELRMSPSDVGAVENISWVTNVRPVVRLEPASTSDEQDPIPGSSDGAGENNSLGVQQVHQNGITGEGVKVGIIDTGFAPGNQAIQSNVVETRLFRDFGSEVNRAHGTSTAEVVVRTAPDSQLYLASVENSLDLEAAIDYLMRQDVDIIIHSRGNWAYEDDGNHRFTDEITAATESGTLFVNAAGNGAQTHWEGEFRDTDTDGFHEWTASRDELNALPNPSSDFSGGQIGIVVRWENNGDSSDYTPYLYNPEREEYIAVGESGQTETNQFALLSADVARQPLDVVIANTQGPANDEIEVIVFGGPRAIERNVPASSIVAPADVPEALAVAAYQVAPGQLAPYSSRGPTDDGRTGIVATGYTNIEVTNGLYGRDRFAFGGTSAAAPYVGGVAALVEERISGDASPAELEAALTSTSDDIRQPGADTASGAGVVNAEAAVGSVSTSTPPSVDATVQQPEGPGGQAQVQYTITDVSGQSSVVLDLTAVPQEVTVNESASTTSGTFESDGQRLVFVSPSGELTPTLVFDIAGEASAKEQFDIDARLLDESGTATSNATVTVGGGGEGSTTAVVELTAVPDGLQQYNITLSGPSDASITEVQADALSGNVFQVTDGGVGGSSVTARAADLGGAVEPGAGRQRLFTVTYDQSVSQAALSVTVNELRDDDGNPISTGRVTLADDSSPFPNGLPGTGSQPADPDNDGVFEDVDGDGEADFDDAIEAAFVQSDQLNPEQVAALDFDGDGDFDFDDAIELAFQNSG